MQVTASVAAAQAVGLPATPVLSAGHLGLMSANRGATPDHGASPTCDQAAMSSAMSSDRNGLRNGLRHEL